jgi:hypothetical protein
MVVEMRTYKIKPGKRTEFLQIFRERSIPAHAGIGMKILGPFLSLEDPNTLFLYARISRSCRARADESQIS